MAYPIKIIKEKIEKNEIRKLLGQPFEEVVKFVVDIEIGVIALGGELHSDAAEILTENGSDNRNLWGGNLYPLKEKKEDKTEYSSLINIKPSQGNFSMDVQDKEVIKKINEMVENLIYGE